jgi:hypothetical protein
MAEGARREARQPEGGGGASGGPARAGRRSELRLRGTQFDTRRTPAPVFDDVRVGGATSLRAIAAELNARGMLTRRGGRWHVLTVMNLLDRLGLR